MTFANMHRIPRHFHFIFGLRKQSEPFHVLHYLCLESCLQVNRPEKLMLYYHYEPYGPYWDLIKDRITLEHLSRDTLKQHMQHFNRNSDSSFNYAHHSDFIRLEKLLEHGGVYADMDTLFLRPIPDELYNKSFVLGREIPATDKTTGIVHHSLCNALILSEPGAPFADIWLKRMPDAMGASYTSHSCRLAHALSLEFPQHIHVEPAATFYPFMWTYEDMRALLKKNHGQWNGACSVHLWASLWWSHDNTRLDSWSLNRQTERHIRKVDTTFTLAARRFLPQAENWPRRWLADMMSRYRPRRHA